MELKGRLKLIAEMAGKCDTVCDIGTDHAYIPIYLVENKFCKRAVAADVREGPVLIAKENVAQYGLEAFIDVRLGYGLDPVDDGEEDVFVIAGMGGMLVRDIISRGMDRAVKASKLVLQPMNAPEVIRGWLYGNGFEIVDEALQAEGRKLYCVMCARWTGAERELDEVYNYIGIKLIEKKDPLIKRYVENWVKYLDKVIEGLGKSNYDNEQAIADSRTLRDKMLELI